ncbi:MAG: response regulator [Clostridium sp.]|nr:response regulator [Clostridium sp.]
MNNTILLIDDNMLDNAIVKNCLYDERYSIISAVNGLEALELIESRNVDLILLDIIMPIMDGYGFLGEFSKTLYHAEIPVIVATNLDDPESIEKTLKFDIFDYIVKPFDDTHRLIFINKVKTAIRYRNALLDLKRASKLIKRLSSNT